MKVLLITPSYRPIIGGSEELTRNTSDQLNEAGIQTDIMCLNMNKKWNPIWKKKTEKEGQAHVFKIPAFNLFPGIPNPIYPLLRINVLPKLSFIRKLENYDIIHFIGEAELSFPILSHFVKKPKIMHCCGMFEKGGIHKYYMVKRPYLGKIFGKVFPRVADWFIIQESMELKLLSDLGVPQNKIFLLPHGIDGKVFAPDETKKRNNLLLFVGRIERTKGLHILVEALSYIEIPTQLVVIGPRWDEEYVRETERMAQAINKKGIHNVEFLGPMNQMNLVEWYQKAAVVVCPFSYETYSFVVLEALACGTPVVSTGTHILKQGSDGIITTTPNPKKLAYAIKKILNDPEARKWLGKEGRSVVEQLFSWDNVVKDLVEFYKKILHDQNSARWRL